MEDSEFFPAYCECSHLAQLIRRAQNNIIEVQEWMSEYPHEVQHNLIAAYELLRYIKVEYLGMHDNFLDV